MHNSGCRWNKHTKKNYYNFCVSFLEGHLLHKSKKLHPDRQKSFIMIWMTLETILVSSLARARFTRRTHIFAQAGQINWLFISDIAQGNYQLERRAERISWSKSKIYDSRNAYNKQRKRNHSSKKTANRFKSAFLVLCCSNICRMSTKNKCLKTKIWIWRKMTS